MTVVASGPRNPRYDRTSPEQQDLFSPDTQYLQFVGDDNFYGFLAGHNGELFGDRDFAELYCSDFGEYSGRWQFVEVPAGT